LGNTKAICRKCYIHPAIFDAYLGGKFLNWATGQKAFNALHPQEAAVMVLLREVRPQKPAHASAKSAAA
jgi:DNA topoisomerase-1